MKRSLKVILVLICLLALSLSVTALADSDGVVTRRVMAIGNNNYEGGSELHGCINDATRVAALYDTALYGGKANSIRAEVYPDLAGQGILDAIATVQREADEDDETIFFYSGHGYNYEGATGIVGVDLYSGHAYISMDTLAAALAEVPGRVIVYLDSCHSGGLIGKGTNNVTKADLDAFTTGAVNAFSRASAASKDANGKIVTDSKKFVVLAAASKNEYSWETSASGRSGGLFTLNLVDGLGLDYAANEATSAMPADKDKNKKVTAYEAYKYIAKYVPSTMQSVKLFPSKSKTTIYQRTGYSSLILSATPDGKSPVTSMNFEGRGDLRPLYVMNGEDQLTKDRFTVKSSNADVAYCISLNEKKKGEAGNQIYIVPMGAGKATITVTDTLSKKKTYLTVRVSSVAPESITVLYYGEPTMNVALKDYDFAQVAVKPTNATYTLKWKSADTKIATVDKYGAIRGVKTGETDVTVKAGAKSASIRVVVGNYVEPISMTIDAMGSQPVGQPWQYATVRFDPADATIPTVTWKSSNPSVIAVDKETGKLTYKKSGSATITATAKVGDKTLTDNTVFEAYNNQRVVDQNKIRQYFDEQENSGIYTRSSRLYANKDGLYLEFYVFNKTTRTIKNIPGARFVLYNDELEQLTEELPGRFDEVVLRTYESRIKTTIKPNERKLLRVRLKKGWTDIDLTSGRYMAYLMDYNW